MSNVLVDTNVLIYAMDNSSEYYKKSQEILTSSKINLFITTKNISEYFAVCTKLKIDKQIVFGFFGNIRENSAVLYPNKESIKKFEMLIEKYYPSGNRIYDLEIVSVMLANDIEHLATFNPKDFEYIKEISIYKQK